jgi:SAM-dependent methyltransferase
MADETPLAKPAYWTYENAQAFGAESVARVYRLRLPFPDETFAILADLAGDPPRRVLDVGTGNGKVARPLAARVDHVDALDISEAMIAEGRRLPGGDSPNLTWILGRAEDAPLHPPYALVTASSSLHWMDWHVVLPRFARALTPNGMLALPHTGRAPVPWDDDLKEIRRRYSAARDHRNIDLIQALEQRGLFRKEGERQTALVPFTQSLDDYVESFHSYSAYSRERLTPEQATAMDAEIRALVRRYTGDAVELQLVATVIWGKPLAPEL